MLLFILQKVLEQKIEQLIEKIEGEMVKSITAYQFYLKAYLLMI